MPFRKMIAVGARRTNFVRRGRSDGRPSSAEFKRNIRDPFRERTLAAALTSPQRRRGYDVFDYSVLQKEARLNRLSQNSSVNTARKVLKEAKADRCLYDSGRFSQTGRYLPRQR